MSDWSPPSTPPPPPPPPPGWGPPPGWNQPPPGYAAPPGYGPPPGYAPQPFARGGDRFGRPLASWGRRFGALIIDSIISGLPGWILLFLGAVVIGNSSETNRVTGEVTDASPAGVALTVLGYLAGLVLPFLYFALLNGGEQGQTVAKRWLGIQVRDADTGGPIGIGKGFLRQVVSLALGFACGLGTLLDGLWPLWDDRRQTIHDKAASSVVIRLP